MIVLPDISALELLDVYDRGVPNMERVTLRVKETTEMSQYGLLVAWTPPIAEMPTALPINDNLFWFGDGHVNAGEYIFVYTGAGEPRRTTLAGSTAVAYVTHWGRPATIFANTNIVPVIVRFADILIGAAAVNLPQSPVLANLKKVK